MSRATSLVMPLSITPEQEEVVDALITKHVIPATLQSPARFVRGWSWERVAREANAEFDRMGIDPAGRILREEVEVPCIDPVLLKKVHSEKKH